MSPDLIKEWWNSKQLLGVLAAIKQHPDHAYISEFARQYDYAPSTVTKYFQTLDHINFVTTEEHGQRNMYRIQPENRLKFAHVVVTNSAEFNLAGMNVLDPHAADMIEPVTQEIPDDIPHPTEDDEHFSAFMIHWVDENPLLQYLLIRSFERLLHKHTTVIAADNHMSTDPRIAADYTLFELLNDVLAPQFAYNYLYSFEAAFGNKEEDPDAYQDAPEQARKIYDVIYHNWGFRQSLRIPDDWRIAADSIEDVVARVDDSFPPHPEDPE